MRRRTSNLQIAIPGEASRGVEWQVIQGIADYARTNTDWHLSMVSLQDLSPPAARSFDGFIGAIVDAQTARRLADTGKPVVDMAGDGQYAGTVAIGSDHRLCGQMAAEHYLDRHFRNFAFCGWNGLNFSDARGNAFVEALRRHYCTCESYSSSPSLLKSFVERLKRPGWLALPNDAPRIERWLKKLPKPVGIFCANDMRCWQLAEICYKAQLRVPEDVALLGADNDFVSCLSTSVMLSSVDTAAYEIGRQAAVLMDRMLRKESPQPVLPVLVKPRGVVARESTETYPVEPAWLSDVLRFIRANVANAVAVSDVVKVAGRSYQTVEKVFARVLGCSPNEEIMKSRMEVAERLLDETTLSLGDIAKRAGFRSHQYFCLCFAKMHRMSPGEWRLASSSRLNIYK